MIEVHKMGWKLETSPKATVKYTGWMGEMSMCWRYNRQYVVMARRIQTAWGEVIHACIRNQSGTDISWSEKQWIKNSLFGEHSTAIEVFPRKDRLVDVANVYHLWILEKGFELPFGIHENDKNNGMNND